MSTLKSLLILLFFSLILTQGTESPNNQTSNQNEVKEQNEQKEPANNTDEIIDEDIEETEHTTNNTYSRRRPEYDKFRPFNLSYDEMDKMIDYLQSKWLLNPTAVMRHALAVAYEIEVKKDQCD